MEASQIQPPVPPDTTPAGPEGNGVTSGVAGNSAKIETVLERLRGLQKQAAPIGQTKKYVIPGYEGCLGVELQYIDSEVVEEIVTAVQRETKDSNGKGSNLLASIDTIERACKRIMIRSTPADDWIDISEDVNNPVKFDARLSALLNFSANSPREVIIKLFGRDHAIINLNVAFSQWLADGSKTQAEDFLL